MSTTVRFKFDAAKGMADRLDQTVARGRLVGLATKIVNSVTTEFNDSSIKEQTRDINLTQAYVRSKTDVTLAQPVGRARAEILTRGDLTVLGNFAPLSRIVAPGAQRRAGPIAGFRSAGVRVAIKRSKYLSQGQWFIMPLRRGTADGGNGFGVFVRDDALPPSGRALREGRHGKRHIYGPSPYSLFRRQIDTRAPEIQERLATRALQSMGDDIAQGLI
jgi:hypothetical protein